MFKRDQMIAFFQQVDELEASLDAGDSGTLSLGCREEELVSTADAVLKEIAGGLSDQTGFTKVQLVMMSHSLRETLKENRGLELTHEHLMERAPDLLQSGNSFLSEEERDQECILSGFCDAHGYWRAAQYYAGAGMEEQSRKCIAGARYWKQRIIDSCRD
jgi:hypothetical protein